MKLLILAAVGVAIGLAIAWVPFPINLVIPAGVVLLILMVLYPLGIVVILLGLSTTRIFWRAGGIAPEELIYSLTFLVLLGASFLRELLRGETGRPPRWETPLALPVFCMGLLGLLWAVVGILRGHLFAHWTSDLNFILFFWLYFVIAVSAADTRDIYKVIWPTASVTIGVVLWGIASRIKEGTLFIGYIPGFAKGMAFSSTFFILSVCLFLFSERGTFRRKRFFLLSLFFGLHQFLSFVRVAWISQIGAASFLLLVFPASKRRSFLKGMGIFCLLMSLVFITSWVIPTDHPVVKTPTYLMNRFMSIFTDVGGEGVTMRTRYSEWGAALRKYTEHPILGHGLGTQIQYILYSYPRHPWTTERYIHSSYIYYLLNTGPIGLTVFLWFCFVSVRYGLQVYRRLPPSEPKGLALGMTASVVFQIFSAIAGNELSSPLRTLWTGFFLGTLAVIDRQTRGTETK